MMSRGKLLALVALMLAGVFIAGELWVLASTDPTESVVARLGPWPVACTTRGCVSSQAWARQVQLQQRFAAVAETDAGSPSVALTTLIRQHLVRLASVQSPVTEADARRYREEILNATDETSIQSLTGLTNTEYDELIVVPFLAQESLRQERSAETTADLFQQLAGERAVVVLSFGLQWDREAGAVAQ